MTITYAFKGARSRQEERGLDFSDQKNAFARIV